MSLRCLVSVIVPVYNSSKYLKKCIDSIVMQTYENLEIILVDDGSTDGSEKICDEYLLIDKRIKVYHIANSGVAHARNYGIIRSSGDYIAFIDNDDTIAEDYIMSMVKQIKKYNADICRNLKIVNVDDNGKYVVTSSFDNKLLKSDKRFWVYDDYKLVPEVLFGTFNALYKRDIFSIMFPKLAQGEDTALGVLVSFYKRPTICFNEIAGYYYTFNPNSITRTKGFSLAKFTSSFKAFFSYMVLFEKYGKVYRSEKFLYRLYDAYLKLYQYRCYKYTDIIYAYFTKHLDDIIYDESIRLKLRMKIYVLCRVRVLLYPRLFRDKIGYLIKCMRNKV